MKYYFFGLMECPDCVEAKAKIEAAGAVCEYRDLGDLRALKAFLTLRDTAPEFAEIRGSGSIGIPCFADERGKEIYLDPDDFLRALKESL